MAVETAPWIRKATRPSVASCRVKERGQGGTRDLSAMNLSPLNCWDLAQGHGATAGAVRRANGVSAVGARRRPNARRTMSRVTSPALADRFPSPTRHSLNTLTKGCWKSTLCTGAPAIAKQPKWTRFAVLDCQQDEKAGADEWRRRRD